ncbi:hypothetical protein ARMSODRAFT_1027484 [Armillaria solidipes]|uniref:Uncharacterized protein n=1 Tax=Armillaria solidipes TaxID=1076256 RepID=A0A2H3B015_9AGAR|nr:hypothetical protein ARMSODRAFT_1027484 [Armillaria solidipes]
MLAASFSLFFHRGQGNQVSVEFNLLYHRASNGWRTSSRPLFSAVGKSTDQVTLDDFKVTAITAFRKVDLEPRNRVFGGMARQADSTFNNDDLTRILQDATDKAASMYHAWGTLAALRTIEIMGMEQDHRWGCCTMNEFCEFLSLAPIKSFSEWSTNLRLHGRQSWDFRWVHDDKGDPGRRDSAGVWRSVLHDRLHA